MIAHTDSQSYSRPLEHPNIDLLPDVRDSQLREESSLNVRCMQFLGPVGLRETIT